MHVLFAAAMMNLLFQGPAPKSTLTGNIKIHEKFASKVLGNERTIRVYLPPQYDSEPTRRFPVLYVHDGQNIFDGATSYIPNQEWRVDETAESLIRAKLIDPMIVVGIDNAGMQRADEFLPIEVSMGQNKAGGKADLYGKFLMSEVMPWVNQTYRTQTGPQNTGLMGSSFGGVISLYLGLKHPDTFGKLGLVSPSTWIGDGYLTRFVQELPKKTASKIWLDMGTAEGRTTLPEVRKLRDAFIARGWKEGRDFAYVEDGYAEHNEASWARRVGTIFMFLYRK